MTIVCSWFLICESFDCRVHTTGSNVFSHSAVNSNQFQFSQCECWGWKQSRVNSSVVLVWETKSKHRHIEENMKVQVQASLLHSKVHKMKVGLCCIVFSLNGMRKTWRDIAQRRRKQVIHYVGWLKLNSIRG